MTPTTGTTTTTRRIQRKPVPLYFDFADIPVEEAQQSYAELGFLDFLDEQTREEESVAAPTTPNRSHRRLRSQTLQEFPAWMALKTGSFLTESQVSRRRGASDARSTIMHNALPADLARFKPAEDATRPIMPIMLPHTNPSFRKHPALTRTMALPQANAPTSSISTFQASSTVLISATGSIADSDLEDLPSFRREFGIDASCTDASSCGMSPYTYSSSSSLAVPSLLAYHSSEHVQSINEENWHCMMPKHDLPIAPSFDISELPTVDALVYAASLEVIAENGARIKFGSLFLDRKTIVVFIRHFWCPMCQDYMYSISQNVAASVLRNANVDLIVISNGDFKMIKAYRRIFRMPFQLYTDPELTIYRALGMTQTLDGGMEKGAYIRHGLVTGIGFVIKNALKARMPVWKNGGTVPQLGGEYVMGPGLKCDFAHRMHSTRSHMPILRVLEKAGIDLFASLEWLGLAESESNFNASTVDSLVTNECRPPISSPRPLERKSRVTKAASHGHLRQLQMTQARRQELEELKDRRRRRREGDS